MTSEKRPDEVDRSELAELTRRVEKLEKKYIFVLEQLTNIHKSDLELGKILEDLFTDISKTNIKE